MGFPTLITLVALAGLNGISRATEQLRACGEALYSQTKV